MTNWSDIRSRRTDADATLDERIRDERRLLEVTQRLAEAREARGMTQRQLAARIGVSQPNVSRIEGNDDLQVTTLGRYVAGLGGALRIAAHFPDGHEVVLLDEATPLSIRLHARPGEPSALRASARRRAAPGVEPPGTARRPAHAGRPARTSRRRSLV